MARSHSLPVPDVPKKSISLIEILRFTFHLCPRYQQDGSLSSKPNCRAVSRPRALRRDLPKQSSGFGSVILKVEM
jgi:hypothetical protein